MKCPVDRAELVEELVGSTNGPQQKKKSLGTDGAMDRVFEAISGLLRF